MEIGSDSSKDTVISEKEMIEKLAQWIVDSGVEAPSLTLLYMFRPLARMGVDFAYFYLGAFIPLLNNYGYDFLDTFEKRENVELLIQKVEQLSRKRDKEKREKHGPFFFDRIRQLLGPKKGQGE